MREFLDLSAGRLVFLGIIDSSSKDLPITAVVGPETSKLDEAMQTHREQMVPIDPGLPYAIARPQGGNFRFKDTCGQLTAEPEKWRDFIRHDFGSGDYHSRFSAERDSISMVMALHTAPEQVRLSAEQERLHQLVFEHMERAARLAYRPPDLRLVQHPTLVVDADGHLVDAGPRAEALLEQKDGIIVRHGRVRAADPRADRQLQRMIAQVCRPAQSGMGEGALTVRRTPEGEVLLLRLSGIPLEYGYAELRVHRCAIEIVDPTREVAAAPELLSAMFDLTPREAEIASLFSAEVSDIPAAARRLGIGYETARGHLRSIFAKCGVSNQLELGRLLTRLSRGS